jgi:hypothetical protein
MSSRIRGRRYRNADPDERYGFSHGEPDVPEPVVIALSPVALDGDGGVVELPSATVLADTATGASVTVHDTTVSIDPGSREPGADPVVGAPSVTAGPPQGEG